jgi:hypothetical protein
MLNRQGTTPCVADYIGCLLQQTHTLSIHLLHACMQLNNLTYTMHLDIAIFNIPSQS